MKDRLSPPAQRPSGLTRSSAPAAVAGAPATAKPRITTTLHAVTLTCGLLSLAVGATFASAWFARASSVLRLAGREPMVFNAALAFMVTGAALVVIVRVRWGWAALAAGLFDVILGLLVLAEYALGRGLGIDQLVVTAYIHGPSQVPGRIAVNTAVCFTAVGAGLLAWAPWQPRPRPAAIAAAGSVIAVIAIIAAFGYAARTPTAYAWGRLSGMAPSAVVVTLILALGLLSAAWTGTVSNQETLPRWLPASAGVAALGLASAVWLAVVKGTSRSGRIGDDAATISATVLGLAMAGLLALAVLLLQRSGRYRQHAQDEAARRAIAEAEAQWSETRTFQFLEAVPTGLFIATPGGKPYYANQEAIRLLGKGIVPDVGSEQLADTYDAYLAGTDQLYPTERLPVVRALAGERCRVDDMEIHQADGSVLQIEIWSEPIYGPDRQVDYAINAFADITERKADEHTISAQAALLELAHDAILTLDLANRITYWNSGAERTYGFSRADALGQIAYDLLGTEFPRSLAELRAAVDREGRWEGELAQRRADGRTLVMESRWAAQRSADGTLTGVMEVNRDITARKAAERELLTKSEELRQRTIHLDRANKNLEAFTYSVAHDLRAPLRATSGFAEALVEEYAQSLDETGRRYCERIQAASQRMGILIDDLLHLGQVSRAVIRLRPVDLSAEAVAIAGELRSRDPARVATFVVQPGVRASADQDLIRSVLQNLLENAWKFTSQRDEARIEFGAMAPGEPAEVCCFVRDNGAGFDPAYAGKLFRPFQRLHAATDFPGNGIGLASVRQVIERHGGRVWAEGAVGCGATFYFTLHADQPPGTAAQRPGVAVARAPGTDGPNRG